MVTTDSVVVSLGFITSSTVSVTAVRRRSFGGSWGRRFGGSLRCGLVGVNCFGGGLEGLGLVEVGLGVVVLRASSLSAGFPLPLNCSKYLCKAWKLESGDPSILLKNKELLFLCQCCTHLLTLLSGVR